VTAAPEPPSRSPAPGPVHEGRLIWGVAIHQLICWGTLYSSFPVFLAPMEAEFGWSRAETSGALTAGLLAAGLLVGWALVPSLPLFYALWIAIGAVQAMVFSDPAFAAFSANSRDPRRAVQLASFVTGVTSTIFLPLGAALIELLGWRGTLLAYAGLQLVPAAVAAVALRGTRGSLSGASAGTGEALRRALRRPAFWALAVTFCALAFAQTGLTFHILPLLEERGLPLAAAIAVVAVQGPAQLVVRATLLLAGSRLGDMRRVGVVATAALVLSMLALALAPPTLAWMMLHAALFGVANGVLVIVRAAGTAEILGREGYGQIIGALTACAVLPRTVAPLALALLWEAAGSYALVPWVLVGVAALGALAFLVALADRAPPG